MRRTIVIALVLSAALLSACGDNSTPPPAPGSAQNPLVAQTTPETTSKASRLNEASTSARNEKGATTSETSKAAGAGEEPGYQKLLERQTKKPQSRFTPCNLVTKAQAASIVGASLQDPLEAPQGPTCIYRSTNGKSFVTLAIQSTRFSQLKRQIRKPQQTTVGDRKAYCGKLGQPMLYVPLSGHRVLSVAAPCDVAKQFAATAVQRLNG